jgi:hypothetical protein
MVKWIWWGYEKYLSGKLEDYELPMEVIERYLAEIANYPKPNFV